MTSELTRSEYFELIVNWFLNLLVRNVTESEIKREKVQMKPLYNSPYKYWPAENGPHVVAWQPSVDACWQQKLEQLSRHQQTKEA